MSVTANTAFITEFDTMVKHAYQGMGMLRDTVRNRTQIGASQIRFPTLDAKAGVTRGTRQTSLIQNVVQTAPAPGTSATAANQILAINSLLLDFTHGNQTATMVDYVFPEMADEFDLSKINFDIKQEYAKAIGMSMGRTVDQVVINAANAAAVTQSVAAASSGMTIAKLLEAKRRLDANGVMNMERCFVHDAESLEELLTTTQITSTDYNTVKTLVNGDVNTFLGFGFKMINDRSTATGSGEGGLPLATNVVTNFAYAKDSIGLGFAMEPKTSVDYLPEYVSYLINGMISLGAVVIDPDGVVKVAADHS